MGAGTAVPSGPLAGLTHAPARMPSGSASPPPRGLCRKWSPRGGSGQRVLAQPQTGTFLPVFSKGTGSGWRRSDPALGFQLRARLPGAVGGTLGRSPGASHAARRGPPDMSHGCPQTPRDRAQESGWRAAVGSTGCQSLLPRPAWTPVHPESARGFPVRTPLPRVEDRPWWPPVGKGLPEPSRPHGSARFGPCHLGSCARSE